MNGNQDNKFYLLSESEVVLIKRQAIQRIAEAAVMDTLKATGAAAKAIFQSAKDAASKKVGDEMLKQVGTTLKSSLEKAKKDAEAAIGKYIKDPREKKQVADQALWATLEKLRPIGTTTTTATVSAVPSASTSR